MEQISVAVIDDDEALGSSLADLMRAIGYDAECFGSAETFLASPKLLFFDCIIADVYMPKKGGLRLVEELHEQGIMTPVILITGQPSKRLDAEAVSMGAHYLLKKPFQVRSLLDCVEKTTHK
jgi:FixJ family two-component response regulator